MTQDNGEVVVRDLGSTNGIRINGQRVEMGRLRPGDELSIAHIRYRLDSGIGHEMTLADGNNNGLSSIAADSLEPLSPLVIPASSDDDHESSSFPVQEPDVDSDSAENPLARAVRGLLPAGVADRCRIQVIVQMRDDAEAAEKLDACRPNSSP